MKLTDLNEIKSFNLNTFPVKFSAKKSFIVIKTKQFSFTLYVFYLQLKYIHKIKKKNDVG